MSTQRRLPDWFKLFALPLSLPALAAAYLLAHWSDIPATFASHWAVHGEPNGWTTRTPLHILALPIFAIGMCLWITALGVWMYRETRSAAILKCAVVAEFMLGIVFGGISIKPVAHFPIWTIPVIASPAGLILILVFASQVEEASATDPNALFVPKKIGMGYTINMHHPQAWRALAWMIAPLLALVLFLFWAL